MRSSYNPIVIVAQQRRDVNSYMHGFQKSDAWRWREAVNHPLAVAILLHLFEADAKSPQSAVTYTAIAQTLGCHKWAVRRIIAGEGGKRRRKSLLQGLVHYPERYRHSGCYLTHEGIIVAKLLAEGKTPTDDQLEALAEARRQRIAESHAKSHAECHAKTVKCHAFPYNMPFLFMNECSNAEPSKPLDGLAAKLWQDYGMKPSVAADVVTHYEIDAIKAAMELTNRRNGAIYNPAGFIVYLLRNDYAQRRAEAKRERQDPDLLAQKVKEAVEAQTGVKVTLVDGSPAVAYNGGWLHLPLDPAKAIDFVLRHSEPFAPSPSEMTDEPQPSEPFGNGFDHPDDREPDDPEPTAFSETTDDEPDEPQTSELVDNGHNCLGDGEADPTALSEPLCDGLDHPDDMDDEPDEIDGSGDYDNPFVLYPFAAPSHFKRKRHKCPRCGREGKELKRFESKELKRFERCYRHLVRDAELERWDGKEVCYGDPASCWDSLAKGKIKAFKQAFGISDDFVNLTDKSLPDPNAWSNGFILTDASTKPTPTLSPNPVNPTDKSPPSCHEKKEPTAFPEGGDRPCPA